MPTLERALIGRARGQKPFQQIITTWSIILMGCDRHIRVNFFFNRLTNCRASGSTVNHLQTFLRQRLGQTAVGIKVGDIVYRSDEQMMRDSLLENNGAYFVVYEDYTPSYLTSIEAPPLYAGLSANLPDYDDTSGLVWRRSAYFEELVYYTAIPFRRKTISIRLPFNRRALIDLNNKQTTYQDHFRHALMNSASHKAQGIALPDGTVLSSDAVLFDPRVNEHTSYRVVYGSSLASTQTRRVQPEPVSRQARNSHSLDIARDSLRRIGSNTSRTVHRVTSSAGRNSAQMARQHAAKSRAEITGTQVAARS